MNFEEYRPFALRTAKMFPTQHENLRHAALGLITELGEFATEAKRMVIYGREMTPEMRDHMIEEIGDMMWYVPLGLHALEQHDIIVLDAACKRELAALPDADNGDLSVNLAVMVGGIASALVPSKGVTEDAATIARMFAGIVFIIDYLVAPALSMSGNEIRRLNIEKLRKRFPEKYSDDAAEARADKGGLPASVS